MLVFTKIKKFCTINFEVMSFGSEVGEKMFNIFVASPQPLYLEKYCTYDNVFYKILNNIF